MAKLVLILPLVLIHVVVGEIRAQEVPHVESAHVDDARGEPQRLVERLEHVVLARVVELLAALLVARVGFAEVAREHEAKEHIGLVLEHAAVLQLVQHGIVVVGLATVSYVAAENQIVA